MLCHLDVVPAGDGWTHDPFGGESLGRQDLGPRHDGRQGPRSLRALRLEGAQRRGLCPQEEDQAHRRLQRRVRLAVHRALQRSRAHARERASRPMRISPSSMRKRAFCSCAFTLISIGRPSSISRAGARPTWCAATAKCSPQHPGVACGDCGLQTRGKKLISVGKSAHGSTPELGVNAMLPLLGYFERDPGIKHVIDSCSATPAG